MARFSKSLLSILTLSFLLTGCWDLKDLQEINYLTALGFDLEEGKITVYGQMLDFSTIAKSETAKSGPTLVWVGRGSGKTLLQAVDDLYRSSQLRTFYGHNSAIVIGDRLLKDQTKMKEVKQFFARFFELRYTAWIFGTKEKIGDVFAVTATFDLSPEISVLHQPLEIYRQRSVVHPISVREYALGTNEPGSTVMLPSIAINDKNWSRGKKPRGMLTVNGAYALEGAQVLGWFAMEKLFPMAWTDPRAYRGPLVLYEGGEVAAGFTLYKPKIKIHPRVRGDQAEYAFEVALSGTLNMSMEAMPEAELEQKAAELVKADIRKMYMEGLKKGADLLNLRTVLFRKKYTEWKRLRDSGGLELTPESLASIDVKVKIRRTGNLKSQTSFQ